MITSNSSLIDIPDEKGIHIKAAGTRGEKYVYKYVKYFRNEDGASRNKAKLIGKYDSDTGKMYPNKNFFEMYSVDAELYEISVWSYGYTYLALKVCRDTGLLESLATSFGTARAVEIAVIAAYIVQEGNVMDAIDDWQKNNYLPNFTAALSSQSTSRIFHSITDTKRYKFFQHWIEAAFNGGSVCYDVTSISSYAQDMPSVEWGYNRDGDSLCQFNLGMFCDETTKTPLYYSRYNGSLTDKTNLSYVLATASDLGIKQVKMVLDGGFWKQECFTSLHECCAAFTVGMPAFLTESEKVIATYGKDIENYTNELSSYRNIYCVQAPSIIYGISGRVLLYYDAWNHLKICEELSARIECLKVELCDMKRYPKNKLKRYIPYFTITKHENDSGFDFAVDIEKVEQLRRKKGFFLLFSTDMTSTANNLLYYYRAKDADEKLFAQIKCEMDGDRMRTHNEKTTEGKAFVTFIACVIRAYMLSKLSAYLTENSTSMKKVFNQLSDIFIVSSSRGLAFTKALTKMQKQILSVFGASDDILKSVKQ
jgi:transposase